MQKLPDSGRNLMEIIHLVKSGQRQEAINRFRENFDTSRNTAELAITRIEQGEVVELSHLLKPPSGTSQPLKESHLPATKLPSKKLLIFPLGLACLPIGIISFVLLMVGIAIFFSAIEPDGFLYEFWLKNNPKSSMKLIYSFGGENAQTALLTESDFIAADKEGNIFVAEFPGVRIQQFDKNGQFIRVWSAGEGKVYIKAIEVDLQGVLYVAYDRTILRYDTETGMVLDPFPNPDNYSFEDFKALPDQTFVAMVCGDNLVRLNSDGSTRWIVKKAISTIADEKDSRGLLAIDAKNKIFIAGTFVESVFVYSYDGRYLNRIGSEGKEEGQFTGLTAITIDGQNRVLVNDWGWIEIFQPDGRWLEKIQLPRQTRDMDVGPDGLLYVATKEPKVYVFELKYN
ncbi:MAG: NHL repeat-containing protein [Anaerolineaceae bacterium]|nr:NHL repeat-containing protein [Anaerolineaceae bacterium]